MVSDTSGRQRGMCGLNGAEAVRVEAGSCDAPLLPLRRCGAKATNRQYVVKYRRVMGMIELRRTHNVWKLGHQLHQRSQCRAAAPAPTTSYAGQARNDMQGLCYGQGAFPSAQQGFQRHRS